MPGPGGPHGASETSVEVGRWSGSPRGAATRLKARERPWHRGRRTAHQRARRHGSFPTTADMGLWARGPSADALYEELAMALVGAVTDRQKIQDRETRSLEVTGSDPT